MDWMLDLSIRLLYSSHQVPEHEYIVIVRLQPVAIQVDVVKEECINYALYRQVAFFADLTIEEDIMKILSQTKLSQRLYM